MTKTKSFPQLMGYAGKHKYLTYVSWVLSAISALMALLPFVFIWLIVKEALEIMPNFGQAEGIVRNGWWAVGSAVLSMLIYFGGLMCSHLAAFRVASNIRKDTMAHIAKLPLGIVSQIGSGRARRIVNESSSATETYLAHQLPDMVVAIVTPIAMLAMLLYFDWRLGLISLVPIIIAFMIMSAMTGKKMKERMVQYNNALEDMNNEAVEYIRGIPVVKTFGQTVFSFTKFKGSIDRYTTWVTAYTKQLMQAMLLYTTIINSVFAVLIGAALIMAGKEPVSSTLLLNLIFYIIFTPIISVTLTKIMYMSKNSMVVEDALSRIHSITDRTPLSVPTNPQVPLSNSVELCDVSFCYEGSNIDALKGVNIQVNARQIVALVGPSGGGKTTVAGVIARFWDVKNGAVKIGGVNVQDIKPEVLADTIAYVFQDSKLLKASILDNVRLAKPKATREEVLQALHNAQCDDIIAKLPNGIDTVIGAKGVFLSGGEQQRIAIARVMLKNAPIVVLDEATAFADPQNEYMVQLAFEKLAKDRTIIMIAHRLSTIKNADTIYVMDGGKVVGKGNHDELVRQNDIYSKMWNDYLSSISWKVERSSAK